MPISNEALGALREAIRWNPTGARELLAVLREHPTWVKYKADEFGPLALLLGAVSHRRQVAPGVDIPYRQHPFPETHLPAYRQFGLEWRGRLFSKAELAQEVARILRESDDSDDPDYNPAA